MTKKQLTNVVVEDESINPNLFHCPSCKEFAEFKYSFKDSQVLSDTYLRIADMVQCQNCGNDFEYGTIKKYWKKLANR
jgi:hypothetical protein